MCASGTGIVYPKAGRSRRNREGWTLWASDSGSNALFLDLNSLSCSFLREASDSGSKALFVDLETVYHTLFMLDSPSGSKALLFFIASLWLSLVLTDLRLQRHDHKRIRISQY